MNSSIGYCRMLELILVAVATIFLAKRSKKRRYSLRRVRISPELLLSTLATDNVLSVAVTAVAVNAYRAMSIKAAYSLALLADGEGPITVVIAHSDYDNTEIGECLASQASIDRGNKIANEQANRLVRVIGSFTETGESSLNDGKPIKTRLNWYIGTGDSLQLFYKNEGNGTLTTGAFGSMVGEMWVKDSV